MSSPDRRWLFLVNPGARTGREGRAEARLAALLRRRRPEILARSRSVAVRTRDETRRALEQDPAAVPVAVGGDGTANMVVAAMRDAGDTRALCVLPLGTGNAFHHAVGVGRLDDALAALESDHVRAFDVMTTTHPAARVALVSLSTGFESLFIRQLAAWRKPAPLAGAVVGFATAAPRRWAGMTVTADGETIVRPEDRIYNAGLYNMRCYAMGRVIYPDNDPVDGACEAVVFARGRTYWQALASGLETRPPRTEGHARSRPWKAATIETPHPIQFDGESAPGGSFTARVEPGALPVFVPGPSGPPARP